jgi:hypothetical protein
MFGGMEGGTVAGPVHEQYARAFFLRILISL